MKLRYNAPTTLTFSLISGLVLLLSATILPQLTLSWFSTPTPFKVSNLGDYFQLVAHPLGHKNIEHYIANFSFILILGPILEVSYGSIIVLIMMLTTSVVTGILQVLFFPNINLLGASGIVFMMILLVSFTNFKKGEIPISFILVLIIYLGREIYAAIAGMLPGKNDNISQFSHIIGGLVGSFFGFFGAASKNKKAPAETEA